MLVLFHFRLDFLPIMWVNILCMWDNVKNLKAMSSELIQMYK
jgi:hypothetical protein